MRKAEGEGGGCAVCGGSAWEQVGHIDSMVASSFVVGGVYGNKRGCVGRDGPAMEREVCGCTESAWDEGWYRIN